MNLLNFVLVGKANFAIHQIRVTVTQQKLNSDGPQLESCSARQTCCLRILVYSQNITRRISGYV
jgi:hypothetical protein